jgi:CelD/BcsL family acetyltransferase involved in cellulose biosynthesis
MPTFDIHYAAYSPGRVLTYYLLEYCFTQGVEVFDFTIGAEAYKFEWTGDAAQLTSFVSSGVGDRAFRYLLALRDPAALTHRLLAAIRGPLSLGKSSWR